MSAQTAFYIDCSSPVSDNFFNLADFAEYLNKHMKVNELKNNLSNKVTIETDAKDKKIVVTASVKYSKRACRYYARKFIKKIDQRDRFHLISTKKDTYEFRPYRVATNE